MFTSHTSIFPKSPEAWDTSFARKYLKISDEELKKLDPEWSLRKQQFGKKSAAEKLNSVSTSQKEEVFGEDHETAVLINHERSVLKTDASVVLVKKSALPPRKKAKLTRSSVKVLPSNSVNFFLTPTSSSICSSTGLPDIGNMSSAPPTLPQSALSPVKRSVLDATYVVSSVLEDKTNDMEIISDIQSQTTSSTQEVSSKKRIFEKFGAEGASQKLSVENVSEFGRNPVFSNNPLSEAVGHGSFLNKKLKLLERRFSPSKDFSLTPSQEAIMAQVNLSNVESHNNVSMSASNSSKVSSSQPNIHCETNVEVTKTAGTPKSDKSKDTAARNELSKKEYAGVASKKSKSNVFEEESFVSQPIPCGQPLPSNPSNSTIRSQVAEPSVVIAERSIHPSVLSAKRSIEEVSVQEAALLKANKVGRKKKLRSKGESTSRRPDIAKSGVSVQYTAEQICKMIEMLNNFHSAM